MIEFSIPMVYSDLLVDKVIALNKLYPDIKITSVFGALGRDTAEAMGWENYRDRSNVTKDGNIHVVETIAEMSPYIQRLQANGITFQYCLNSTKTMTVEDLYAARPKIFRLCDALIRNNVHHLKISTLLLYDFILSQYGDAFTYYLSTTKEYSSIRQYKTLLDVNPLIKEVCIPTDLNRDYNFLCNFQKAFPNVEAELMTNEGCIYACPWRKDHTPNSSGTHIGLLRNLRNEGKTDVTRRMMDYYTGSCRNYRACNPESEYLMRRSIMPFDIRTYESWGIHKFKFAGRDVSTGYLFDTLENYLKGIDDYESIKNLPWSFFNNYNYSHITGDYLTIDQAREYYPVLEHFKKIGSSCHANCGVTCTYCYDLANKLHSRIEEEAIKCREES